VGPQPVGCSLHNIRYSMKLVHVPGRIMRSDAMSTEADAPHRRRTEPRGGGGRGRPARPACSGPGARIGRIPL
jgi:hypothetical protein